LARLAREEQMRRRAVADGYILVVDDDSAVRALTRRALTNAGFDVLEAGHADGAMRVLGAHPGAIRLVILDIGLPGISGLDLANFIERAHPGQRLLYVSGMVVSVAVDGLMERTPSLILLKPFTATELTTRVRMLLD
jgi:DNA-binding response OmpR family regulator